MGIEENVVKVLANFFNCGTSTIICGIISSVLFFVYV